MLFRSSAKMQYAMNNNAVKFIFKSRVKFFRIFFNAFCRNKNFSFNGRFFFAVLKRNNIREIIVLQKSTVDFEQLIVGAKNNAEPLQVFLFTIESLKNPSFYLRGIFYSEIWKPV